MAGALNEDGNGVSTGPVCTGNGEQITEGSAPHAEDRSERADRSQAVESVDCPAKARGLRIASPRFSSDTSVGATVLPVSGVHKVRDLSCRPLPRPQTWPRWAPGEEHSLLV